MADYKITSPWFSTVQSNGILQPLFYRIITPEADDILYQIDSFYNLRPDLLSADQYGTPKLWWVFMHRNPDVIKDPIWDFKTGVQLFLPKMDRLKQDLGI